MAATILVADDSVTMRLIVESTLAEAGWRVLSAADGGQALDIVSTERVDLLVTDWHMAPLSGQDLVWALRARPATAQLPVIVLSTEDADAWREVASEFELAAWLQKPLDPVLLIEQVRRALSSQPFSDNEAARP